MVRLTAMQRRLHSWTKKHYPDRRNPESRTFTSTRVHQRLGEYVSFAHGRAGVVVVVVVVVWGFTTLVTSQVIGVTFYSEREKSDKFCSETWVLLRAVNLRHGTHGFTSPPNAEEHWMGHQRQDLETTQGHGCVPSAKRILLQICVGLCVCLLSMLGARWMCRSH